MLHLWEVTLTDAGDPYHHTARAKAVDTHMWSVNYTRNGQIVVEGTVSVPHTTPSYTAPMATLMDTLGILRKESDYWAAYQPLQ